MKKYLTLDQQLELLKTKGLNIPNEKFAKTILRQVGYYKLVNAYKTPFTINKEGNSHYLPNVDFEYLYYLHQFDLQLESIVFQAITSAEIELKAHISELISKKYGTTPRKYLKASNYLSQNNSQMTFIEFKANLNSQIKQQEDKHPAISWYKSNYSAKYPFWVIANILTIGNINKLYSFLKNEDKIAIAKEYKLSSRDLSSFIMHINLVRNVCAHNDILFRYKSKNAIPQNNIKKLYTFLDISKFRDNGRYEYGTNDFLSTLIVLKYMINDHMAYNNLIMSINGALFKLSKKIPKEYYEKIINELGLNKNWKNLPKFKK